MWAEYHEFYYAIIYTSTLWSTVFLKVTSIAMLQTLSYFFAAKCPEGWRGAEVCYRAQRRRILGENYQRGTALKYGRRGLANSVLGFHVVRRGFSAPWGAVRLVFCRREKKWTEKGVRKGVKERGEAKGTKAREIERNSAEEGSEEADTEVVTFRFGMPDHRAPSSFYKAAYEIKKLIPPDTSSRRLEIAAKWKAPAKRYRVGANTKGKHLCREGKRKEKAGRGLPYRATEMVSVIIFLGPSILTIFSSRSRSSSTCDTMCSAALWARGVSELTYEGLLVIRR
ncbi:Uncharacterized protein DBV15_01703, partial [Temnothorax longispinosus]